MTIVVRIGRRTSTITLQVERDSAAHVERLSAADRADLAQGLVDAVDFTLCIVDLRRRVAARERRAA